MTQGVVTVQLDRARRAHFTIEHGRPLAASRLVNTADVDYPGKMLPGLLRRAGAVQVGNRIPVAVAQGLAAVASDLERRLDHDVDLLSADTAWIRIDGCRSCPEGSPVAGYLLAAAQLDQLRDLEGPLGDLVLPNGQIVRAIWLGYGRPDCRPVADPLSKQPFVPPGESLGEPHGGWWTFQSTPSSDYSEVVPSSYAYHVVLHRSHCGGLGEGFVVLRNRELEERFPDLDTTLLLRVAYSERISPERAAVEEAALVACGLREGEPCWISRMSGPKPRTLFQYRHVLCRVGPASTVDQDKPLCRVPEHVLEAMGSRAGEVVRVETYCRRSNPPRPKSATIRALVDRPQELPALRGGAPDFRDEVGHEDLPTIRLDATRQEQLDVTRGSAVYVRPRVVAYTARAGSSTGFVMIGAVLGAVASEQLVLGIALAGVVLAAHLAVLWTGLRR